MTDVKSVLEPQEILQKIRRIAYEIWENNFGEEALVLAGIDGQGYLFARMLQEQLQEISGIKVQLAKVSLDKLAPSQSDIELDCPLETLTGKSIILADDVLNTGRTLAYCLKPFLQNKIRKLEIAVLVNRSHTSFPVQARYTGYELATTLSEHIRVALEGDAKGVYLQ